MSYYSTLGLMKEPFSTSPDPSFFFRSDSHVQALTRLEIAIRLRRGLSLILGDVGTGKTTLARTLLANFPQEEAFAFHMILDPSFESEYQFLLQLARMFGIRAPMKSTLDCREAIEHFLFQSGVTEQRTTVLLIDEGQKLSFELLENLRVLLNYETNEFKLLQLVLLGQLELQEKIKGISNFFDRISYKGRLEALDYEEMKEMISFRIRQAGYRAAMELFLEEAFQRIYEHTEGYPRQVTMFCHRALKELLLKNKFVVDRTIVENLIDEDVKTGWQRTSRLLQKSNYSS